jgi:hypothetical protein
MAPILDIKEIFIKVMENSFMVLCKSKLFYESVWLKIGIARQLFMKLSSIEFYANLSKNSGPDTRSRMD